MNSFIKYIREGVKHSHFPILLLLLFNILIGYLTFQDYGLSWDEPLFYKYADSIGYAYSIPARLAGDFDIEKAYGPSAYDHKNRGPAYLLLAYIPVTLLERIPGIDNASAWHLVNFLTFQVGVYFLYSLCRRWVTPWSAFAATLLFSSQPIIWGHAFINPKDTPFMVFFLGTINLGFLMVDKLNFTPVKSRVFIGLLSKVILPGIFLGIVTSIRILGPFAGGLVFLYALLQRKPKQLLFWFVPYASIAALTIVITWPYLWENPIARFIDVVRFMSSNPTQMHVLFNGELYRAYELPRRYLPILLGITFTEPVWILFAIGLLINIIGFRKRRLEREALLLILAWFFIPFLYVIFMKPPMYDGYRHFLFILPPIFIFTGTAFETIFSWMRRRWINGLLVAVIALPGFYGSIRLHPYEYTYYNTYVGGTTGAYRKYETDYWLTCYKETMERFNQFAPTKPTLLVHREYYIAEYYAADGITVKDYRGEAKNLTSGDYILVSTRSNEDKKILRREPIVFTVGRNGATYCIVKQVGETW